MQEVQMQKLCNNRNGIWHYYVKEVFYQLLITISIYYLFTKQ
jgi:hypothetical protein